MQDFFLAISRFTEFFRQSGVFCVDNLVTCGIFFQQILNTRHFFDFLLIFLKNLTACKIFSINFSMCSIFSSKSLLLSSFLSTFFTTSISISPFGIFFNLFVYIFLCLKNIPYADTANSGLNETAKRFMQNTLAKKKNCRKWNINQRDESVKRRGWQGFLFADDVRFQITEMMIALSKKKKLPFQYRM